MSAVAWLPAAERWHFDWRSALIGAALGWVLLFFLYRHRATLRTWAQQWFAPLLAFKQRMQSNAEEKYRQSLQQVMRRSLLFSPRQVESVVRPPRLRAEGALPAALPDAIRPVEPLTLTVAALLQGHPRLLITGDEGGGRTTTLIALAQKVLETEEAPFPLWVDLRHLPTIASASSDSPLDTWIVLAARSLPHASERMIGRKVTDGATLFLVDGWDDLTEDMRQLAASRLAEAAEALPQARWAVAASPLGCGLLVERGFVPLTPEKPTLSEARRLYASWTTLLGRDPTPPSEVEGLLRRALASGDGYLHLTLRLVLYLRHGEVLEHLADLLPAWLEDRFPLPEGVEVEEGEAMRAKAWQVLEHLAYRSRIEGLPVEGTHFREALQAVFAQDDEEVRASAGVVKSILDRARVLVKEGGALRFRHFVWADLFAARALAGRGEIVPLMHHLDDPAWVFLIECFVALGQADELVRQRLRSAVQEEDVAALLRVARWATLAPADVSWRKPILTALARFFTGVSMASSQRLEVGRALALVAGEEARPFFLKALRHPDQTVREAALRGLGWTGTVQELRVLAAAVNDPHPEIREAAVRALGDLGTGGALRLLSELLYRGDEALMLVIAETLAGMPDGWELLKEAAQDADLLVRRAAAHGLGRVPEAWAEHLLTRMAREDGEWLVRSAADAALAARQQRGRVGEEVPAPPQVDAMPWLINWAAQQGLGVGVGKAAYTALLHALEYGEPRAQILAARTLARIGRREDIETLRYLLKTVGEAEVRSEIREALRRLEVRYAVPEDSLRLRGGERGAHGGAQSRWERTAGERGFSFSAIGGVNLAVGHAAVARRGDPGDTFSSLALSRDGDLITAAFDAPCFCAVRCTAAAILVVPALSLSVSLSIAVPLTLLPRPQHPRLLAASLSSLC